MWLRSSHLSRPLAAAGLAVLGLGTLPAAQAVTITADGGEDLFNSFFAGDDGWQPHLGWVYDNIPAFTAAAGDTLAFDANPFASNTYHMDIAFGTGTLGAGGRVEDVSFDGASFATVVDDGIASSGGSPGPGALGDFDIEFTLTDGYSFPGGVLVIDFSAGDRPGVPVLDFAGVARQVGRNDGTVPGDPFLGRYWDAAAPGGTGGSFENNDIGSFRLIASVEPDGRVPAPGTLALLGIGVLGLGWRRLR